MKIVMLGPFGMYPRMTMRARALPLARALVRRGHTVVMLLPPWQNPEDAGRTWQDQGVQVENLTLPVGIPGWFHGKLTLALARRALNYGPDVVHAFKPKAYAGLAHWLLTCMNRKLPVVVDTDDWEGPGGWNDLNPYPALLRRVFTWQERWGLRHAAAVTVASRALQTLVWATGGALERVFYLPNGVEVQKSSAPNILENAVFSEGGDQDPTNTNRPTLLLYTRFFEFELERLWRILQQVRACHPNIQLLVVGKGLFGEEQMLLNLARQSGWRVLDCSESVSDMQTGDKVVSSTVSSAADLIYTGYVSENTLPAYFAQADIAVYPFDDTLLNRTKCPVKLLDLLAAGVPVVADAVGQITESVRDGQTGFLVSPGDEEAFARAVLRLLADDDLRQTMRACAIDDVHTRLSWDKLAEIAERAYDYVVRIPFFVKYQT